MAQLRQDYALLKERGLEIIVLGPEKRKAFATYFEKNHLLFTGIPDPTHSVLKLYGQEVKLFKLGRMPAQVLIDCNGVARFVHYGHSMSDIPASEDIIDLVDELIREAALQGG